MKVLIAPCSFKESLTASDVAECVAQQARAAGCAVDVAPLADGGEGTLAALVEPLGLQKVASVVRGMLGGEVRASFGLRDGRAVIEIAEVVGLSLVPPSARDIFRADTRGVGDLMNAAVRAGADELWVALGGSGTVDGGAGMLATYAGGARSLTALVDVDVPLAGALMFARQKLGLGQRAIDDSALAAHVDAIVARFDPKVAALAGAGAAGGLGAALASLGASLVPGARFVMDALAIDARVAAADVVVTGEGRVDEQSTRGKLVGALADVCRAHKKRLVILCGDAVGSHSDVVVVTPVHERGTPAALAHARDNVRAASAALFARLLTEDLAVP